jgi:hypothetical protein
MKAIDHSGFTATNLTLDIDTWARKVGDALRNFGTILAQAARPAHREPSFRERHLLDRNLGPAIRRSQW